MAVELKVLIEKVSHMDITMIAGEKGLSNMVSWVHMVETEEASTFLEGGEIAFSTGIGLSNSLSLLNLVKNIWENKAAGIVLNTGPFLENIPKEVIAFGNSHNFPIFTVPWKIHIAEIMRIFSYTITKSDQAHLEIAAAFKNAIFFPKQEELYVIPLSQRGFHANWKYHIYAIKIIQNKRKTVSQNRLETICTHLDNHLHHHRHQKYAVFYNENQLYAVVGDYNDDMLEGFTQGIQNYLEKYLSDNEHFYIGIGNTSKNIRCLYKSHHQALAIQKLRQNHKIDSDMISYANMGIYQLLLGIEDTDILNEYYEKTIRPLEEYDQKNNSDLTTFVRCYLKHDGSVKDTADELFVHRNTVNYKINKASEILKRNLSCLDHRLQLTLGFMIKDML